MKNHSIHVSTYLNDVELVQTRELLQIPAKENYIRDQITGTDEVSLKFSVKTRQPSPSGASSISTTIGYRMSMNKRYI
jgi:hypothetical protein